MTVRRLDVEPYFSSAAQEAFSPGDRVYLLAGTSSLLEGATGSYLGRVGDEAVVDWDTGAICGAPFTSIQQLYR